MSAATKASILAARAALAPVPLEVPELGGTVHVARLTARQADQYAREVKAAGEDLTRAAILSNALVTEAGERLFGPADVPALADLPNAAAEPVVDLFGEVNGMGTKKASPTTSSSTSASPSPSASGTSTP